MPRGSIDICLMLNAFRHREPHATGSHPRHPTCLCTDRRSPYVLLLTLMLCLSLCKFLLYYSPRSHIDRTKLKPCTPQLSGGHFDRTAVRFQLFRDGAGPAVGRAATAAPARLTPLLTAAPMWAPPGPLVFSCFCFPPPPAPPRGPRPPTNRLINLAPPRQIGV